MPLHRVSFVILETVDSTNNYAMQQVHAGKAKHGDSWFALEQTHGRGRRGRQWITEKGENVVLSIVADSSFLQIHEQFQLSAATALACYDLFKGFDNVNTKIKWPNDLFWSDRKAGGILIENVLKGNIWQWSVIGVGININQLLFPLQHIRPVSLKQITGNHFDPVELGRQLYANVMSRLAELKAHNFRNLLEEYNSVLYKKNEKARLKKGNVIFETTISGVSPYGQLQTMDTIERSFRFDEVEWLL